MSKYIVTDLDGTLFQNQVIRETDLIKLTKFVNEGNKVILNTGRSATLVAHLLKTMPIDYAICNNGNLIVDKEMNILFKSHASVEELNLIVKNIITPSNINSTNGFDHEHVKETVTIDEPMFLSISPRSKKHHHSLKIVKEIEPHLNEYEVVLNHIYVDVGVKGYTKATGIKFLQELLEIADDDIMVFGDNLNDVTMFKEYHDNSYFITTGNQDAKKYAKYTIDYVSDVLPDDEIFEIH